MIEMTDIVFPKNNEEKFIAIAERLGIDSLCFAYDKPIELGAFQAKTKLKVSQAIICNPETVRKYKGKFFTIVKSPEDQTKLRHIFEQVKPDIIYGLEFHHKRDFMHHRASGLNQVLATIAKQKGVAIGFNFSDILKSGPREKAIYIGRMMQNIRFARKFKFQTVIASFSAKPWHLRPEQDIASFFRSIGMTPKEAKEALDWK
jgi:RNase P/RNase MRP subunit p30